MLQNDHRHPFRAASILERELHRLWPFTSDRRILLTFSHPPGDVQAIARGRRRGRKGALRNEDRNRIVARYGIADESRRREPRIAASASPIAAPR